MAQKQGRQASRQWFDDDGELASAKRKEGQSAAEWQAELFDTLVRRDPITAFGAGPIQEALLEKRVAYSTRYSDSSGPTLDVGCGNGHITRRVAEQTGRRTTGIDVSQEAIRYASTQNAHPDVQFQVASVESFDPGERFGLITLYEVLEHVDDPDTVLARVASWLRPGGRVIVSTPNRSSLNRRIKRAPVIRWIYRTLTKFPPDAAHPGHVEEYEYHQLLEMVRSAGLEIEHVGGVILLLPFPEALGPLSRSRRIARLNVRSGEWCPRLATDVYVVARLPVR
jgi:2-polyprenyl-3-methyl-5-hydroxy-6-metoxy-1,4-benzoquinol methylase